MTPQEFEKMVHDYVKHECHKGSTLICLPVGENNFRIIHGKGVHLAATIAANMFVSRDFARLVRLACEFYDAECGAEKAEAAKTVSKYLDRMGFKKEE